MTKIQITTNLLVSVYKVGVHEVACILNGCSRHIMVILMVYSRCKDLGSVIVRISQD